MDLSPDERLSRLVTRREKDGWVPEDPDAELLAELEELTGHRPVPRRWIIGGILLVLAMLAIGYVLFDAFSSEQSGAGGLDPGTSAAGGPSAGAPGVGPSSTAAASAVEVTVHVAGAVEVPGLVTLSAGSRVADALEAAGGTRSDANPSAINLARILVDGEQIIVPVVPAEDASSNGGGSGAGAAAAGTGGTGTGTDGTGTGGSESGGVATGAAGGAPAAPLSLSTATAADLDALPGVGPATATAIITHREENGPFVSVDDLLEVPGIGPAKMEKLRPLVTP